MKMLSVKRVSTESVEITSTTSRAGEAKMEGWLYCIRPHAFGLRRSKKRYFVLGEDNSFCWYRTPPTDGETQEFMRSAQIDSSISVSDDGRESINGKIFFTFTLYNSSKHNDQLKLGARSSDEAAIWIKSLTESALKVIPVDVGDLVAVSKRRRPSFRFNHRKSRRHDRPSIDWSRLSSMRADRMMSDVIAPSPWEIISCINGLRLFKEKKDHEVYDKNSDDHPALMAIGVIRAPSETIFQTVMTFGSSRSEWDFTLEHGSVIQELDGHTDIIHKKMRSEWLPGGMKPRDLVLQRYWRREDDGTYVILYHSVFHRKCRPERGFVRANIKSGGYVISPINEGRQSVVKHMLALDWKLRKSYLFQYSTTCITTSMLERIAALREMFEAKGGNFLFSECSSDEMTMKRSLQPIPNAQVKVLLEEDNHKVEEANMTSLRSLAKSESTSASFGELSDATDEYFDILDDFENDQQDEKWALPQDNETPRGKSTSSNIVKKLSVQKRSYIGIEDSMEHTVHYSYGATLWIDKTYTETSTCASSSPSTFLVRGWTYLQDRKKITTTTTLMELVAADWMKSDKREDDLGGRPGGIVQKYATRDGGEFFFIVHIQVPGSTTYSLAFYYMLNAPLESVPLLERFVKGDDAFRNARFKLIPHIAKGSWIVKQSVGQKACLVGRALKMNYFQGTNYLEIGVDIGSSAVARGVVGLVLGYLNKLIIEMAFLIQGESQEELPEFLIGTCRLNHLDASKAVLANSL